MTFVKSALAAIVTASLILPSAAAERAAPLPAGKPAGVQNAAMEGRGLIIALGVGAIVAFTVSILTADQNGVTSPVTTATSTGGQP